MGNMSLIFFTRVILMRTTYMVKALILCNAGLIIFSGCATAPTDHSETDVSKTHRYASPRPYVILTNLVPEDPYYAAVSLLQNHRNARIVKFDSLDVSAALWKIRSISPEFVCLVLRPETLDINFTYDIFDLSTRLDDDPFPDFTYGFITGSSADKAKVFVENIIRAEKGDKEFPRKLFIFGPSDNSGADDGSGFAWLENWKDVRLLHEPGTFPSEKLNELTDKGIIRFFGHGYPEGVDKSLSSSQLDNLNLYPAVVFAGPCFSAVVKKYYEWGCDDEMVTAKSVSTDKSLALKFIDGGITAYLGAMHENRCVSAAREMEVSLSTGAPLGMVMKHTYDTLIMANDGRKPVFPRLKSGKKTPNENAVDFQINRAAGRILLGDPMYQPFTKSALITVKTDSQADLDGIKIKVQINEPRMRFCFTDIFHDSLCTCDSDDDVLYFRIELPDDFPKDYSVSHDEVNCPLSDVKHGEMVWAEEYWLDKRYLHIQIGFTHDSITEKGQEFYFKVIKEGMINLKTRSKCSVNR